LALAAGVAGAAEPRLRTILPRGGARGGEVELRLLGERLGDAFAVLFEEPGVEALWVAPVGEGEVRCRVRIAEGCPLGPTGVYVATRSGVTNVRLFAVGQWEELAENEPNNDPKAAVRVPLNATVGGVIENEDVDCFGFEARAGERINFEVEGLRLGDSPLDPMLVLLDAEGRELAAADDLAFFRQDCALAFTPPADGVYVIQVREAAYAGGGQFHYRLHLGTFPRPLGAFPPGGRPGETVELEWLGDDGVGTTTMTLPATPGTVGLGASTDGFEAPSPVPFRIAELEGFSEIEPNDHRDQATTVTLPGALHGRLQAPGDEDWFRFDLAQGQTLQFQLYGRRLRSPLDAVVTLFRPDGGAIETSDDAVGPDSALRLEAPADGTYFVRITDHLRRGGPLFVYRLEAEPPPVGLAAGLPESRKDFAVPIGGRVAQMIELRRVGYGGPIEVALTGPPPGLRAILPPVDEGLDVTPMLLEADAGTTFGAALAGLELKAADPNVELQGGVQDTVALVRIQNNVPILEHQRDRFAVAVTQPAPFRVHAPTPKAPLVRQGRMLLPVEIERAEGYQETIRLRLLWNPPGVTSGTAQLEAGQTTATLELNAAGNAPTRAWKLAVLAAGAIEDGGRGTIELSSELVDLTVSERWIDLAFQPQRTEQGTEIDLVARCSTNHPYEGEAQVELLGLPPHVEAPTLPMAAGTEELRFGLKVGAEAPTGRFELQARATVLEAGEAVVHHFGPAELRIDAPLPPPAEPTPAPEVAAEPTPKPTGPQRGDRKLAVGIWPFDAPER